MWRSGKCIGKIKGEMLIDLPPLLKQSLFGTMTENGLERSDNSLILHENTPKYFDKGKEMNELAKMSSDLNHLVSQYYEVVKKGSSNSSLSIRILHLLKEMKHSLTQNTYGKYARQSDLWSAQQLFIKSASFLLEFSDQFEDELRRQAYDVTKHLMERKELDLEHLGFKIEAPGISNSIQKLDSSQVNPTEKLNVGHAYHSLLNQCLKKALENVRQKGLESYVRSFVLYCLSYCYFRMTSYQRILEEMLEKESSANLANKEDWRKHYWGVQDYFKAVTKNRKLQKQGTYIEPELSSMFDWEQHFFLHLESQPAYKESQIQFEELVKENDWKSNFTKKGVGFFYFLVEASFYIRESLGESILDKIDYMRIPGYEVLISSFIYELKSRDVKAYSDALISALVNTVEVNPKLISPYFYTVCHKTK